MSTKINARSPFYIEAVEPTVSLGTFTCTTANLLGFNVDSSGFITDPSIAKGTILSRDTDSFATNTSGSSISRTVNYTILIPASYPNADDATIICPQTIDQPTQSAQDDVVQNNNCPTFSGTISPITNLDETGSSISLGTFFTASSGAGIERYEVIRSGAAAIDYNITGTVPNQTLTFATEYTCAQASFTVKAKNTSDACRATSNTFTVSAECPTTTLTCTTDDANNDAVALTGGSLAGDGTINRPSFSNTLGGLVRIEDENDVEVTNGYSANTTVNDRDVTLTFVFNVPDHYTNGGSEIECDKTFTQRPETLPLNNLGCDDDRLVFQGFRIATSGDIVVGESKVLYDGIEAEFTANTLGVGSGSTFPVVYSPTSRNIGVDITIPTGYLGTGNTLSCTIQRQQSPIESDCVTQVQNGVVLREYYISTIGIINPCEHCGRVEQATYPIFTTLQVGGIVCDQGNPFNGGDFWWLGSRRLGGTGGDIGTSYTIVRIDRFGYIAEVKEVNCTQGECYQFNN
tara:strand:- start:14438 stop:15988 length:1551 start_codon:yes stop_codon:yes gene_type:complete